MTTRHRVDGSWWRRTTDHGDIVVAGSPRRLFRFSPSARPTLVALESANPTPDEASAVVRRLVAAGAVHPVVDDVNPVMSPNDVTVIVPAHDESSVALTELVASVSAARRVIVVDDGSTSPVPPIDGADVVRRPVAGGPGAARNSALDLVDTPLVLFLDADTCFDPTTWRVLLAHFDDDSVVVVAPRVRSIPADGVIARYERTDSPLDLGDEPARIAPGTRVSYVPTAALVMRTTALGGHARFDESLRYGEDVDLVWRIGESAAMLRYEPSVEVGHRPRTTWRGMIRQRVAYGSAAAPLESRHPGATPPLRLNRWTAAAWTAALAGHPVVGIALAGASTARLARRIEAEGDRRTAWSVALRLAGRGNLHAGRGIASAMWRTWWPITLCASAASRRTRRAALLALVLPNAWRWFTHHRGGRTDLDPVTYTVLRIVDDLSYGAGVWKGAIRSRRASVLRPRFD